MYSYFIDRITVSNMRLLHEYRVNYRLTGYIGYAVLPINS